MSTTEIKIAAMLVQVLRNQLLDIQSCLDDGLYEDNFKQTAELRMGQTESVLTWVDPPHPEYG